MISVFFPLHEILCRKIGLKNLFVLVWGINDWKIFTCPSNLYKISGEEHESFFSLLFFFTNSIFISCYPFSNKFYGMLLWLRAFSSPSVCSTLDVDLDVRSCWPISYKFCLSLSLFFFCTLPSLWSGWYHCELITRRHYQYCFSFVKKLSQYWKICLHKPPNVCTFFLPPF